MGGGAEEYPAEYAAREQDLVGTPFPRGRASRTCRRGSPWVAPFSGESLAAGHRRVLVVGHKGVNRVILAQILGLPLEDIFSIEQDYCAVTVLEIPACSTAPAISNPSTSM